jgi:hypothetical protein
MGCDIHFFVERVSISEQRNRKLNELFNESMEKNLKLKWESVDKWNTEDGYSSVSYKDSFYSPRDYRLFARLADVRNSGINPISEPRGFPNNISREVSDYIKRWEGDGHSHTYYYLDELLEYDWSDYPEFQETIERMKSLDSDTSMVRCIMFFDN